MIEQTSEILGFTVVGAPAALLALLGLSSLLGRPFSERAVSRFVAVAVVVGLAATIGVLILQRGRHYSIDLGNWVLIPDYHYTVKFLFDGLSLPFVFMAFVLCGTVSAFAAKYMHREPGFNRFFVLFAMFLLGMVMTALAGTIETLFAGWELVGLSSTLLVAFFHERSAPVRNGLRVWIVYRISDAALLIAALVLHHMRGAGDFESLFGHGPTPEARILLSAPQALLVGLLLLTAAAGKSALVPFSGWLPRAMEGPTPSSAVFYGALSVHLGAYLLLRVSPLLELSPWLSGAVIFIGASTAVYAAVAGRVQTDIKCALTFASLAQVGIITVEIGLGWQVVALVHLLGHAFLRTLQFLRAPTLLQDYKMLENAVGASLPRRPGPWMKLTPVAVRHWIWRFASERGYLDALLMDYIARPVLAVFRACDWLEHRWTDLLSGGPSRESEQAAPTSSLFDEAT